MKNISDNDFAFELNTILSEYLAHSDGNKK